MEVTINGFPESLPEGISLAEVIESSREYDVHLIVELNHRFVHQKDLAGIRLQEGDVLELIHPAFGG